jgi:hypothetical protein
MFTDILDNAYKVFARYQPPRPLDICTECCITPEEEMRLASSPVKEISRDLMAGYNDGARTAKTSIEEVKHFLPRYLELISNFEFPSHSVELSLARLSPFEPSEWTAAELELLESFSREYFRKCLSLYPIPAMYRGMDSILIMFRKSGLNAMDLLDVWYGETSEQSLLHFRDLFLEGFDPYDSSKLRSPFDDETLARNIRTWLSSEKTRVHFSERIEEQILGNAELKEEDVRDLNLLYEIVRFR